MPNVRSSWRLTYDPSGTPVVLLDIDDRLASEIRWGSTRGAVTVPLLDAVAPFLRDSGNRAVSVSFDRMEPVTTHAALCKAVMTRLISHGSLVKKPLKIEAAGVAECYWLASACLVPSVEPGILVKGSSEMATSYSLVFASIAQVATAEAALTIPAFTPADPGDFEASAFSPADPGDFEAASYNPADPGDFEPPTFSPLDPGDFEAAAFSPADPGDFDAPAFAPANPGDFTFAGFSPSDPGDGSAPVVPGMMVAGTLTPDATGIYYQTSTDIHGLPVYTSANPFVTYPTIQVMWVDPLETGIGFWRMRYQTSVSAGSVWAASVQTTGSVPTPASATGWFPAASFGGAPTATGTPTITAV